MKVKILTPRFLVVMMSIFTTMALFAQPTSQWNGAFPSNTNECDTHTPDSFWTLVQLPNNGPWEQKYVDPTTAPPTTSTIQIGNAAHSFCVTDVTALIFKLSGNLKNARHGVVVDATSNLGANWNRADGATINGSLAPAPTITMTGSALVGTKAYTGAMPTTDIKLSLGNSNLVGMCNVWFRLRIETDNFIGGAIGVSFQQLGNWSDPLDPPVVVCTANNSTVDISQCGKPTTDIRVVSVATSFDGVLLSGTCPRQETGETSVPHTVTAVGYDSSGKASPTASCTVTPTCDGIVPPALMQLSKLFGTDIKGTWASQTVCESGVIKATGAYSVYKANTPNGPWGAPIATSPQTNPTFSHPGALLNNTSAFYNEISAPAP